MSKQSTLPQIFSAALKRTRVSKRLSQEALARKAGVSVSYVSMLEREQRCAPLSTVDRLAKALQVAPLDLLRAA